MRKSPLQGPTNIRTSSNFQTASFALVEGMRTPAIATPDINLEQVPETVSSAVESASQGRGEAKQDLELLLKVLDSIKERGCVQCYVNGVTHNEDPEKHLQNSRLKVAKRKLTALTVKPNQLWSFCFRCWIPFQEPFYHHRPEKGAHAQDIDCLYHEFQPQLIQHLISCVWSDRDKVEKVANTLGTDLWVDEYALSDWINGVPDMSKLPNPLRFVLAFYRTCIQS